MADFVRSGTNVDQTLREFAPKSSERQNYFSMIPATHKDWLVEYSRFQKKLSDEFRSKDLSNAVDILYPLFVITYAQILSFSKEKANEFHALYLKAFIGNDSKFPLARTLTLMSQEELTNKCKEPFEIQMTANDHSAFVQTIKKTKCVFLALKMKTSVRIKIVEDESQRKTSQPSNFKLLARTVPALRNLQEALDTLENSANVESAKSGTQFCLMRLSGGGDVSGVVTCAQVCPPDRSMLAAGCEDASVRIHALIERAQFCRLEMDSTNSSTNRINGSCNSPTNRTNATVLTLRGHSDSITDLAFTQHPRYLLSTSVDKTVCLWDIKERQSVAVYRGHHFPIWSIAYCQNNPMYFATGSNDKSAMLWSTERLFPIRQFTGHVSDVNCCCFHPNGRYLFTGGADSHIRMYDLSANRCARIFQCQPASSGPSYNRLPQQTTSSRLVVNFSNDETPGVLVVQVSPDGSYLGVGARDGAVQIFDISREVCHMPATPTPHNSLVHSLAWTSSSHSQEIVSGCLSGQVVYWSLPPKNANPSDVSSNCMQRESVHQLKDFRIVRVQAVAEANSRVLVLGQNIIKTKDCCKKENKDDLPKLDSSLDVAAY